MPEQMNKSQYEAVHFAEGALLLLAGPGSGKTFVITHRIKYLISEHGVSPERILVITFTKAAATEMQERYKKLTGQSCGVVFGTFHAVFYQILRTLPAYQSLALISEPEKLKMIDEILRQMHTERYMRDQSYTGILRQLSKHKNDPEAKYDLLEDIMEPDIFERFYEMYQAMLKEMGKIDFDDMVLLCYEVLRENSELLAFWQDRFDYLLIDEFQDINALQYEVVKLLVEKKQNIFVVGDDDQSIYGFRGAKPEIMQRFLGDFVGASKSCLEQNYRSKEEIVRAAECIIRENKNRFDKKIIAARSVGGRVRLITSESSDQEMERLIYDMQSIIAKGVPTSEIAILTRTNRELQSVIPYLEGAGISYRGYKMRDSILEQDYVKVLIAYLTYLSGDHCRENFFKFMNKPLRYIKRDAVPEEQVTEKALRSYYRNNFRMQETVATLFSHLEKLEHMKPFLALHYIRKVMGLDNYVKENEREEQYLKYIDGCEYLQTLIKSHKTAKEAVDALQKLSANNQLQGDMDKDGIRLMTYHASKGLEFLVVFLPELIDGKVPPKQAKTASQIEEERRMLYVAVTRAKDRLYLYMVINHKEEMSRFLQPVAAYYSSSSPTSSSNSTESRNSSNASDTASYSSSSSM